MQYIIAANVLETLFDIIMKAIHKEYSPADIAQIISSIRHDIKIYEDEEKSK